MSNGTNKSELIIAIEMLEKERRIDAEVLFTAIEEALVFAYKREFDAKASDNVRAEVDRETGEMRVYLEKEVVQEVVDQNSQISLDEAISISDDFELGDVIEYQLSPKDFGRLAAVTAKSVINQKLCSAEKDRVMREFSDKIGELITGTVQRRDRRELIVEFDGVEGLMLQNEQIKNENYEFGKRMRFYLLRVDEKASRSVVMVSRTHPNLVRKLFEQEVPEIKDGTVEIVNCVREPGVKTKIAVYSHNPRVEALGACVGERGARVQAIMDELGHEKIDIILWDNDPAVYIKQALSPAKILKILTNDEAKEAMVCVANDQLSLAIGREGINARLAARLTGWKVNVMKVQDYDAMMAEIEAKALELVKSNELEEKNEAGEAFGIADAEGVAETGEVANAGEIKEESETKEAN